MSRHRVCMVSSDEEDEDGDLGEATKSKKTSKTQSAPIGEVIYLPEDTSSFQPEDEEITERRIPVVYMNPSTERGTRRSARSQPEETSRKPSKLIYVKNTSNITKSKISSKNESDEGNQVGTKVAENKIPANKEKSIGTLMGKSETPVKSSDVGESQSCTAAKKNNESNSAQTADKGGLKAADLMPPPLKRGGTIQNDGFRKAKYSRQATPICDAIMKEYSKRQKLLKQKGGKGPLEINDLPIQELIKKAKEGNVDSQKKPIITVKKDLVGHNNGGGDSSTDPLSVTVKQEIIDIKPFVALPDVKPDVSKLAQTVNAPSAGNTEQNSLNAKPTIQTNNNDHKSQENNQTIMKKRGRGRPAKNYTFAIEPQKKRRRRASEDDDPDFDPSFEENIMHSRVTTRSGRRCGRIQSAKSQENEKDPSAVTAMTNKEDEEKVVLPKDRAITVAERLKFLAEKIADVLTKDPSPNINSEAEKLLHTTQELIELQRKKLQESGKEPSTPAVSDLQIKQETMEIPEASENNKDVSSESLTEKQSNINVSSKSHAENSLHIFNQLQKHEAALQRKLLESNTKNTKSQNVTKPVNITPGKSSNIENMMLSESDSMKDRYTLVTNYYKSYTQVFDQYTTTSIVPTLSDNIMLCMDSLTECVQRTKRAENVTSKDLKDQEIHLAKQSYLKVVKGSSEKFFPWFSAVIEKIMNTVSSKALIVTLTLYMAGSLFMKAPRFKNQLHRVRRVVLFMSKAHGYFNPVVNGVLEAPADVFDNNLKLVTHMLKYFHARNILAVPADILFNYADNCTEDDNRFQAELSIMDTTSFTHLDSYTKDINSSVQDNLARSDYSQMGIQSASASNQTAPSRVSSITLKFVEALRSERHGNTKRIEEKLDHILNVLSGNAELGSSASIPSKSHDLQSNTMENILNLPTGKVVGNSSQKTGSDPLQCSGVYGSNLPADDTGTLLAQVLESDHTGLDSLFSSYFKSAGKEKEVKIKSEPLDVTDTCGQQTGNLQPIFCNVKQEPEDCYVLLNRIDKRSLPLQEWEPSGSNDESLVDVPAFTDSFTEEFMFTKNEPEDMDTDPLS